MNYTHLKITLLTAGALLAGPTASFADYARFESAPVTIQSIYANEAASSPFVIFSGTLNSNTTCSNNGMYLYNITITGNADLRRNKMAIALSAKMTGSRVVLDYYYDSSVGDHWESCYIEGIKIID